MKKTITFCDKCGKEIPEGSAATLFDEVDICPKCLPKFKEAVSEWMAKQTAEKAKKAESAPAKKTPKEEVDYGKMQALRDAGWTLERIAEEMKVSKTFVYQSTHQPAKKKTFVNEFNAADAREVAG